MLAQEPIYLSVFPTHVGVFLDGKDFARFCRGLPHARGGVSTLAKQGVYSPESSPRTWGCFYRLSSFPGTSDVFPTHVGVFLGHGHMADQTVGLPHARGGVSKRLIPLIWF